MGSVIRLTAIVISVLVVLGFAFFAVAEMDKGSKTQQTAVGEETGNPAAPEAVAVAPTAAEETAREKRNSAPHEVVDDVNDVLLAPFADVVDSDNSWVHHGVPALLALLVYGLGLAFVANLLPKERAHGEDWRAARSN